MKWEIFDPRVGTPVLTVPWEWLASLIARNSRAWDYAREGDGW